MTPVGDEHKVRLTMADHASGDEVRQRRRPGRCREVEVRARSTRRRPPGVPVLVSDDLHALVVAAASARGVSVERLVEDACAGVGVAPEGSQSADRDDDATLS